MSRASIRAPHAATQRLQATWHARSELWARPVRACRPDGSQPFVTAKLIMRGNSIDLFLRDEALTLGTGLSEIAAREIDING